MVDISRIDASDRMAYLRMIHTLTTGDCPSKEVMDHAMALAGKSPGDVPGDVQRHARRLKALLLEAEADALKAVIDGLTDEHQATTRKIGRCFDEAGARLAELRERQRDLSDQAQIKSAARIELYRLAEKIFRDLADEEKGDGPRVSG